MATKADRFRYDVQRASHNRPKKPGRPRRSNPVDTAQPGVSASDRRAGAGSGAARNQSKAAGRKAAYMLEGSKARPSRKSTRRSGNRQKPDNSLRGRKVRATSSPSERARRG